MKQLVIASVFALAAAQAATAGADVLLTPYAGLNFGGSTVDSRVNLGGSLTWLGSSGLGVAVDVGFVPDFFAPKDLDIDVLGTNNVTTLMGNVVYARALGVLQPYVSAGGGLIRSRVGSFDDLFDDVATDNGLGVNAGGGVRVGGGRFSLAADLRYFRTVTGVDAVLEDALGDFSFWRAAAGVSFRF